MEEPQTWGSGYKFTLGFLLRVSKPLIQYSYTVLACVR